MNESFVVKRVSKPFYELSQRLVTEFTGSQRLRMHVDSNQEEGILIYPYFTDTLLALIKEDADLSITGRKEILYCVGEAIREFHDKSWIHTGTLYKPFNSILHITPIN